MNNEPSGSVVPLPRQHSKGVWPTFYGYIRGHSPTDERKLWMRAVSIHGVEPCDGVRLWLGWGARGCP
jgi:hypothetical protein